jgi:hypothetical protein
VLVWISPLTQPLTMFVRDITDLRHPINLCGLNEPGTPRFVSATTVSVLAEDHLYKIDLSTGQTQTLASWSAERIPVPPENTGFVPANRVDSYDISADGLSTAYALITGPAIAGAHRAAVFHLIVNGSDRVLATLPAPNNAGETQVEFAPSGNSVAFGVIGPTGTNEAAPVQVWSLAGRLMFSSPGSNSITWGAGDQLFFDDGTDLRRRDGTGASSLVLAGRWRYPSMSTDRHYVAYEGADASAIGVVVINTANRVVTRLPGSNTNAAFITATLLYHRYSLHPVIGSGDSRIYDMADATDVASPIDQVFSTWPRATPPHG